MTREKLNQKKQKEIFAEEVREKRKKIFLITVKILLIITICVALFYCLNTYIFTGKLVVREYRVTSNKIPREFDGLKIVQFSDLHYGTTVKLPEVKKVVERINYLQPDIVVFTGDLVDKNYKIDSSEQEKIITELSKIKAAVGKYAIDGDEDEKYFNTIFNQCGFSILNNSYDLIYNNTNEPLLLAGVSSSLKKENNIDEALNYFSGEGVNNNIYTIVLEHEPDLTDDVLNKHSSDLILAGHSHNGSIRTPWKSTIFKVVGANKYDNEYYKFENSELFISSGIGTNGSGIRLFCMPSISLYRLSRE